MTTQKPFQFSIARLLILMTIVALAIVTVPQLSPRGLPILLAALLLFVVCKVAAIAIEKNKLLHFWQATFAYVFLVLSVSRNFFDESDAIYRAIFLGLGLMLSIVPLYRGNWVTRLYALPAFAFSCNIMYWVATWTFDWQQIKEYWFG